jgi:hypothetical protein
MSIFLLSSIALYPFYDTTTPSDEIQKNGKLSSFSLPFKVYMGVGWLGYVLNILCLEVCANIPNTRLENGMGERLTFIKRRENADAREFTQRFEHAVIS